MRFSEARDVLESIPYTSPEKGRFFYDFVLEHKPEQCLELGFAHGTSSGYFAAALDEVGTEGHLTAVDLDLEGEAAFDDPDIEKVFDRLGLRDRLTVVRENTSYTWFLKKKIEEQSEDYVCKPIYDFCFLDGSKNWTIDGFAFFLMDKLLRREGWLLFDDYDWTYAQREERTGKTATDGINHREMGRDELAEPHIKHVFQHLVMQHPEYANFKVLDDALAMAQKVESDKKTFTVDSRVSLRSKLVEAFRKLVKR
jgi:predicted O-methyltransferase YrrM